MSGQNSGNQLKKWRLSTFKSRRDITLLPTFMLLDILFINNGPELICFPRASRRGLYPSAGFH